jgi:hypothetical protein
VARNRSPWWLPVLAALVSSALPLRMAAQDLTPRAYVISPSHSNAVVLSYAFFDGDILFEGTVPITDAKGRISIPAVSYYHSFGFFGRSANFTVSLPYVVGNIKGDVTGAPTTAYRSGLLDTVYRFSVNLKGGPDMNLKEFRQWQQKTLVGVSIKVAAPTGQYDPTRLINAGGNRWVIKPEIGVSRRRGHWIVDAYTSVSFFTDNPDFFSRNQYSSTTNLKSQKPIAGFEGHLSYDVRPRFWVSLDGNYWHGGATSLNGAENPATVQSNSRIGATASIPINRHQSVKCSYNRGAYVRFGGAFQNLSVAWQYSWIGKP